MPDLLDDINLSSIKITKKHIWTECPYHSHKSKKATLAIDVVGQFFGLWHCFSCERSGAISPHRMKEVLHIIKKEESVVSVDWVSLQKQFVVNLRTWAQNWMYDFYPPEIMRIYGMGCWVNEKDLSQRAISVPMYSPQRELQGIQFRTQDGFKYSVEGSKLGLFLPVEFRLDSGTRCLYIAEGMSDTATLATMKLNAIGRPNALPYHILIAEYLKSLPFKAICIVADNNKAGLKGAHQLQCYLEHLEYSVDIFVPNETDIRQEKEKYGEDWRTLRNILLDKGAEIWYNTL